MDSPATEPSGIHGHSEAAIKGDECPMEAGWTLRHTLAILLRSKNMPIDSIDQAAALNTQYISTVLSKEL